MVNSSPKLNLQKTPKDSKVTSEHRYDKVTYSIVLADVNQLIFKLSKYQQEFATYENEFHELLKLLNAGLVGDSKLILWLDTLDLKNRFRAGQSFRTSRRPFVVSCFYLSTKQQSFPRTKWNFRQDLIPYVFPIGCFAHKINNFFPLVEHAWKQCFEIE